VLKAATKHGILTANGVIAEKLIPPFPTRRHL
jgi:hypothetical protein